MLNPLRQVLNEAADRFDFRTPFDSVKQLKTKRTDVDPFTLAEVKQILDTVRPDFRHYFTVRFFTGLRTGEVDGLQWKYVDFDNRLILVRETIVGGEEEYTKTDGSQRDIQMSQLVFDALQAQLEATGKLGKFVFCNRLGTPLDHKNVTNRVWYPLLRHLNLKQRRPYQCRHTAATLWLASGEAPEWIAAAIAHARIALPESHYLGLIHALTSARGAPDWLGLCEPCTRDAVLLSAADRLSGQIELMARHSPPEAGFGRFHPHLRGCPYVVGAAF